jgi:hypothetical protein
MRVVTPNIEATAFNCPHCGALASQGWYKVRTVAFDRAEAPSLWSADVVASAKEDILSGKLKGIGEDSIDLWRRLATGETFVIDEATSTYGRQVANLHISQCFNCDAIAIWKYDKMIWPSYYEGPKPNADMPNDVRHDFEEAASIANVSPRGAAALLRLSIQKLCVHLGGKGKNINEDISTLVANGLPKQVQQALDIVRVVGNNAVHPGEIDADDAATAGQLFRLVNIIVEQMITGPRHIQEMFSSLPDGARAAIEKRDGS